MTKFYSVGGQRMASGLRRAILYAGVCLLFIWLLGALFFTSSSGYVSYSGDDGNVQHESRVDARQRELLLRIERLEAMLRQQGETIDAFKERVQQYERYHPRALPVVNLKFSQVHTRRDLQAKREQPAHNAPPTPQRQSGESLPPAKADEPIAVLVFACNRSQAIKNHLDQILKLRPSKERFPVIVSQDCDDKATSDVVLSYGDEVTLIHQPDQTTYNLPKKLRKFLGYYKIARHYRWALNQTFFRFKYNTVIITEDDLDIAPDFFEYFTALRPLLRQDTSLFCVSAWNDNGKKHLINNDATLLWRTDFFPGLGWMLEKPMWEELTVKWPEAYWDDWLREPQQRKMRSCIRPEVPRTAMSSFGKVGVSKGLFFEKHLKHIALNTEFVAFTRLNLSYLLKDEYDKRFAEEVYKWPSITQSELRSGKLSNGEPLPPAVRLTYEEKNTYKSTAKAFGLMDDFRAGVPRMAYRGVVAYMYENTRVYLAPPPNWTNYDPKWS